MAEFEVLRGGSASSLRIRFRPGDVIKAESDALVSKTSTIEIGAGMDSGGGGLGGLVGGLLGGAARSMLTGESFFLQTFCCTGSAGEVLVAPSEQGDIAVLDVRRPMPGDQPQGCAAVMVTNGAFLCAEGGVDIQTRVQGAAQGLFSGSGFFLMRCSGRGRLAVSCLGSCIRYDLQAGEKRQVDNGHLVAWAESVHYTVGMATTSIFGTLASGEGIMCTFTGPGSVWIQSHRPQQVSTGGQKQKANQQVGLGGTIVGLCFACVFIIFLLLFAGAFLYAIMNGESVEWGGDGGSTRRGNGGRRAISGRTKMADEF
mmetsp:Transcript_66368/g.171617  ORF Transcript_66368/g.171617 Transcript_66368/m.171617 type:complete len:314 (-) Transcript_66368:45-986(-)